MQLTPRLAALLTLPPLLWAGNAVVGRLMVPLVPPVTLNALRWIGVLAVLLVLGRRALASAEARRAVLARWPYLSLLGLLGIGAYNALQYMALRTSTPLNVTLISASMPVFMMVVGALLFGVPPKRAQVVGTLFSLSGVLLVLTRGAPAEVLHIHFVRGDLLMLCATFAWSCYSWLLAKPPRWTVPPARAVVPGPQGPQAWNWAEFLLVQLLFGVLWAGAGAGVEQVVAPRDVVWSPTTFAALAYIIVGPSIIAYWFWGEGVRQGSPALASIFNNLTPLFAALLSALLIHELPRWYHGAAFALIVAGIALSTWRPRA
jgi:drug/metabolite transporter (DMT)-like permease